MAGRLRDEGSGVPGPLPRGVAEPSEVATAEPIDLTALGRLRLLVFGDETFVTHPLPPVGVVSIGRGELADVRVEDASMSRLHAKLHLGSADDPTALVIEDLGSSNGTRIRGRPLASGERRTISAGEVIDLGQTMILVQHGATPARPRRLVTHGYFELRLEEECARARAAGRTFAVVRVRVEGRGREVSPDPESREGGAPDGVEDLLAEAIRPFDLLARYTPGEWEVLHVDSTRAQAVALAESIEGALAGRGLVARTSVATYPEDGREPEALVAEVGARVRGAKRDPRGASAVVVVADSAMQQIYRMIDRVAPSAISVLVLGETGTGKEVIAEAIHRRSSRASRELLRLNCAALTESLLESELFGHEKGAFSGAVSAKPGLLETAEGGTVFLDEIGELPPSTQAKLLRVIEERRVRRVGSLEARAIDVRFVSATHRDLEEEIARGGFRRDLFYRLNGISIVIPPLRERLEEIAPLAESFASRAARELGASPPVLSRGALALLQAYSWPGNIRELKNVIDRAVILAERGVIEPGHLPVEKMEAEVHRPPPREVIPVPPVRGASSIRREGAPGGGAVPAGPAIAPHSPARSSEAGSPDPALAGAAPARIQDEIEALEKRRILEALERSGGVQTKAAKMLGWSRGTFLARLEAYDIPRRRKDKNEP